MMGPRGSRRWLRSGAFGIAVAGSLLMAARIARGDDARAGAGGRGPAAPALPLREFLAWPWGPAPRVLRETDRPCRCAEPHEPAVSPKLAEVWMRATAPDPVADAADPLLRGPEAILDGILSLADGLFPRSGTYGWEEEDRKPVALRFFDWMIVPRQGRIFTDLLGSLADRERRFFLGFEDSYLNTPQYELRLEDIDYADLRYEQGKVVLDAIRKAYLMKYRFRPEERIRDDAFGFRGWGGVDFAVLPPVMAGYLCLRGLERKFALGGTELGVHLEPLTRWARRGEDLRAGAGLEWGIRGFPVALIASAGMYGGDVELDFVGVGTSLGIARKALRLLGGED